ncbi:MAG: XRE family transcriptional regulator, partial [Candidatus Aminicenantes bacterium]
MTNYLGKRIANFRIGKRFKQYGFGDYVGCSSSHIWRIENGKAIPDYLLLLRMAHVFGITIEHL